MKYITIIFECFASIVIYIIVLSLFIYEIPKWYNQYILEAISLTNAGYSHTMNHPYRIYIFSLPILFMAIVFAFYKTLDLIRIIKKWLDLLENKR